MSAIRNQVQLIGNLGQKPEIKTFGEDRKFAKFSIATSDYYYDNKGEKKEQTQWHNVVVWGKQAEVVEKYLDKGMQVAVTGKITYRNYDDKDGNKKYITEIEANTFTMLGQKSDDNRSASPAAPIGPKRAEPDPMPPIESSMDGDDLPF